MTISASSGFFEWVAFLWQQYYPLFLRGILNTMVIAVTATAAGFALGLGVAVVRTLPRGGSRLRRVLLPAAQGLLGVYIEVFRGTPMIVQSMVIYYGLCVRLGISAMAAAILIVSVNTGAYMAEIVRGGVISVDRGQLEGALSIGMTHRQAMRAVVLPQAVRNIMPSIGNEFVVNIKDSSVLNVISVAELYFMTRSAAGTYSRYSEAFFIAAVCYFVLTFIVTRILRALEKRMDGAGSYVVYGSQSDSRSEIHISEQPGEGEEL